VGKNTNKKWKDKEAGIYSDKKQARIDKKKGKKMARLKKRAARGNPMASAKLERIHTREQLDELRKNPTISDAEVMQDFGRHTANIGTVAGQGAIANTLPGQEGLDAAAIGEQVGALADPAAAALAQTTDTKNKLRMMQIADLKNRLERNRNQKAQENVAAAQLAVQSTQTGLGAAAGFTNPTEQA
jgi:single-stranded DNA-specific DHH superfamily exonuclease